ncbi:MAG TPA: selenocysteine-specific translation elongation factor [Thermoanaerobaculia bacterium]|nr:selenocysteine-specific translation elongation factor [Thermoanaerobaculia bacterium]
MPATQAGAPPALRVVVGTAGHIDHGKTSLIEALTGIDCDRWAEEKRRGITIDLGFAWRRDGDLQVGFIDVPGHERFLHNALAGLGGIRLALLVVAADEGVKPQTREHLDVCRLLGIPRLIVALTKADLVGRDLVELAGLEVEELLAATPWAGAPRFAVSAKTGEGIPRLAEALLATAREAAVEAATEHSERRPVRFPIDRAFHLKGLGVVVTGTLVSGRIGPGDGLEVLPGGERVRVRSVQVHGESRDRAEAGERTSLQVSGIALEALSRGLELVEPGRYATTRRLLVDATWLADATAPLSGPAAVRVHLLANEVIARARPLAGPLTAGARGPVELRLAAPMVAVRGDRVVLRRPSPPATLGGGVVLDPRWHPPPGRQLAATLAGLTGDRRQALVFWAQRAGEAGAESDDLARRLGERTAVVVEGLAAVAAAGELLRVPPGHGHGERWLDPRALERVGRRARRVLGESFRRDRLARGISKAEAVRRILPGRSAELADVYLPALVEARVLTVVDDLVNLPGREAELTGEESDLARRIAERYEAAGLSAPSPGEVAHELTAKPQIVDGVVRYLVERGRLIRLPNGLIVAASAIEGLRGDLVATGWQRFTVPQFKDRFGLSRKWAIPLLEHLDSTGVTRRHGDERMLVGS